MRCISRGSQGIGAPIGWRVSISRCRGARIFQKFFADHVWGGNVGARVAAQAWRDDILRRYPPMSKAELSEQLRKHNTSGSPGVYRKIMRKTTKNGNVVIHPMWQAQTPLSVVPFQSRSFSVAKFGEEEAYWMAVEARKAFVALIAETRSEGSGNY